MKATVSELRVEFSDIASLDELAPILDLTSELPLVMSVSPTAAVPAAIAVITESGGVALIHAAAILLQLNILGGATSLDETLAHLRRDLEQVRFSSGGADGSEGSGISVIRPELYSSWPRAGDRDAGDLKSDD